MPTDHFDPDPQDKVKLYGQLFHGMLNSFALHQIICDEHGRPIDYRFLSVNPAFEKLTGLSAASVIGKTVLEILPDTEHEWIETYGKVALGGEPVIFDAESKPLGKWFNVKAFSPAHGLFACTFNDITESKSNKELLARTAREWQSTFDASKDAIWVLDSNYRILRSNQAAQQMFGFSIEAMIGQPCWKVAHNKDAPVPNCPLARSCISLQRESTDLCINKRWYQVTVDPILDTDGQPAGAVHVISDITERKQLEESLRAAKDKAESSDRAKSEFLALMSHELRTPLNGIIGFADLLALEDLTPQQQDFARTIRSCGGNLLALISDILDLSKIEADRMEFEPEPCNLLALIQSSVEPLQLKINSRHLSCHIDCDPHLDLAIDTRRTRQVLFNLLSNAVKFTRQGGVLIRASATPTTSGAMQITIVVQDTGIGIAPEDLLRLFQPFTQVDSSQQRFFEGSGLGLTISRKIARKMGGDVTLESSVGQGTSGTFTFLANTTTNTTMPPSTHDLADPEKKPAIRALIVDDDPFSLRLLTHILKTITPHVETTNNPTEAIQMASEKSYTHFFLDIRMPQFTGIECLDQIRKVHPSPACYCAVTAHAMHSDQEKYLAAGFDIYLPKPIRIATIQKIFNPA